MGVWIDAVHPESKLKTSSHATFCPCLKIQAQPTQSACTHAVFGNIRKSLEDFLDYSASWCAMSGGLVDE